MSKLTKSVSLLMIITLLSKVFAFFRELFLASAYGTSMYVDAYVISLNIPGLLLTTVGVAITASYIPVVTEIKQHKSEKEALSFTNNLINIVILVSLVIVILGIIFTEPLVKVFAMGFSGERLRLTINFTRILLVGILFLGINNIFVGFLQVRSIFSIPGLIQIPYSLIIIVSTIFSVMKGDIYILIYGTLLAYLSQLLIQLPTAIKQGYKYKLYINFKDEYISKMLRLVIPVLIGVSVTQINTIVDRTLASTLEVGTISAFNYANRLYSFIEGLFVTSIVSVVYPNMADLISKNKIDFFKNSLVKSINIIILLIIPITVGALVLAHPIVKVLFQRGAFDANATLMTGNVLFFYSIGMVGYALRDLISRAFYSMQDSKTPMINGAIAISCNIALNLILIRHMGYVGLALASSISAYIGIILLFMSMHKKIGYFGQKKILITAVKSMISALVMGVITSYSYNSIICIIGTGSIKEMLALFSSIAIGVLIYGLGVVMLKVDEVKEIQMDIKSKILSKLNK